MYNLIHNGNYYLVARYIETNKKSLIPIDISKYIDNFNTELNYRNNIYIIDYFTTKFSSKDELIDWLYNNKFISSKKIDLYITHTNKKNNKKYINEYDLIFNENERVNDLIKIINIKINGQNIKSNNNEANNIINKFITKCFYAKSFYEFMTFNDSKIDKYIINKIIEYRKKKKINYSIKYFIQEKTTNYLVLRNIISMWNIYTNLVNRNNGIIEEELGNKIIKDYISDKVNNNGRRRENKELIKKTDKNYMQGQITIEEYLEYLEKIKYDNELLNMQLEKERIKNAPFDDLYLQELEKKYGRCEVCNHLTKDVIYSISLEDKLRLGIIDYIYYKNQIRKNEYMKVKIKGS